MHQKNGYIIADKFYMTEKPGKLAALARAFGISYGWEKLTFQELIDRYHTYQFGTKGKPSDH